MTSACSHPAAPKRHARIALLATAITATIATTAPSDAKADERVEPTIITIETAVRAFKSRGYDLLIADAHTRGAQGDLRAAGAVANPVLLPCPGHVFQYDPHASGSPCDGCSSFSVGVGVTDPSALSDLVTGKRGLRRDVAARALDMLKAGRRDVERQLVAQVKTQVALVAGARSALDFAKEVQASAIAVARSQSAVDLAKRERMPDVGWTLSYTQTGTGPNALQPPTLTFGLSLPLPLFYQRQGEISRADADHQGAEWERAKLAAAVRADVQSAWAAFTASRRVVERSQSSLLEKSQKARDITEVQFRAGSASLMDYLDAERAFVQTNIAYRAALVAYWSSVFQLEAAVGSEFLS